MPPYVTLGLAARKALPRSRAAGRNIDFVHTQDGWVHLPASDAMPNPPTRQGRRLVRARNPAAGRSGLTARAAISTAQASARREWLQQSPRRCQAQLLRGSRPTLLTGTNASPSRSPPPGGCDRHNRGCHQEAPGWADHIGSCAGLTTRRPRLRHSTIQARRTATPRTSELVDLAFRPRRARQQATTH